MAFNIQRLWLRVSGYGCNVWGLKFRVQGLWFGVEG